MRIPVLLAASLLAPSCVQPPPPDPSAAAAGITADGLLQHIRVLASDEFEGRLPGSKGEELTVKYLTEQFRALGLEPGNPDGAYIQNVPLAGSKSHPEAAFSAGRRKIALKPFEDYVAASRRLVEQVTVTDSDLVFVGYGVVAPEYGWDDYKGLDVTGKTLLMLINDPAVPDPNEPARLDEKLFKGRAMTYYGRWTYKYDVATEKRAAAAVIIHETGPAGYPWDVVRNSWGGENFTIRRPDRNMARVPVESWITLDKAKQLLKACGKDFDELKKAAVRRDFTPVPLNAKFTARIRNTIREVRSRNVLAKLPGSDPQLRNEYVIYSAHWDHLGRDPSLPHDQIYNGAHDNASGVAALLEIARAFIRLSPPPKRTILFAALTAEEQGLLGAQYYAANPLYPLAKTLANINIDGLNSWGRTRDIVVVGYGNSTLDDIVAEVAAQQGRVVKPDPEPEKGFFYRADHFEFAKKGVPALYTDDGTDYIGRPPGYGEQKRNEFTERDYHKPSDEIKDDWDLSGAAEDVQLLFLVGYRVAQAPAWPEWKPGTEFKAVRDAMLR